MKASPACATLRYNLFSSTSPSRTFSSSWNRSTLPSTVDCILDVMKLPKEFFLQINKMCFRSVCLAVNRSYTQRSCPTPASSSRSTTRAGRRCWGRCTACSTARLRSSSQRSSWSTTSVTEVRRAPRPPPPGTPPTAALLDRLGAFLKGWYFPLNSTCNIKICKKPNLWPTSAHQQLNNQLANEVFSSFLDVVCCIFHPPEPSMLNLITGSRQNHRVHEYALWVVTTPELIAISM